MDESEDVPKDFIKLKSEKLSVDEVSELVISPYCGAVSLFIGTTRNNFEGKKVIRLEYEAYTSMAETEIKKICRDVRQKWPSVKHIAVHHRLGVVPITEASVIIAVSSPHRTESLEAVMYCINTLKASVPIWKKNINTYLLSTKRQPILTAGGVQPRYCQSQHQLVSQLSHPASLL
uniref:Molybdopterin synthase catalytic subunit n=1 Tax=Aquila chrysaetos chrysaetos TaxID=223781 RepID=A0A663EZ27_AQUCH